MSILLQARNIEHSYREGKIVTPVLKGVNLDIASSKMTAIVGKSGSGKSTLLHILGTLDTPDKGMVLFQDKDVTQLSEAQKAKFRNHHLGFIYQFHHLLDDFTVLENVMLPLMIAHTDVKLTKSRALSLLKRVGLQDRLKYLPSELSGGERQRVAIARAMVHSPELILADEPTGNLDEENAATVFNLFRELASDEKTAVVMVTHDLSLAHQCDEIFEMVGGVVMPKRQSETEGEYSIEHGKLASADSFWGDDEQDLEVVEYVTPVTTPTTTTTKSTTNTPVAAKTTNNPSTVDASAALDSMDDRVKEVKRQSAETSAAIAKATELLKVNKEKRYAYDQTTASQGKDADSGSYFGQVAMESTQHQHEDNLPATSINFDTYRMDAHADASIGSKREQQIHESDEETVIVLQQADSNRALDLEHKF